MEAVIVSCPMLLRTRISILLLLLSLSAELCMGRSPADTLSIEVTVLNEQDQPLEAAVVSMHLSNNNSIVKTELTDAKGHARLHKFQPGQYYFVISFTGYTTDTTRSM